MSDWPTVHIESWGHFSEFVAQRVPHQTEPPEYLFRGVASSSWGLVPTLLRLLPRGIDRRSALKIEQLIHKEFRAQAPALFTHAFMHNQLDNPRNVGEVWALMRHYGVPTRILDWTASPYVAAYFAASELDAEDGAIYMVKPTEVTARNALSGLTLTDAAFFLESPNDSVHFFVGGAQTDRASAQQGHFSANLDLLAPHDTKVLAVCDPSVSPAKAKVVRLIVQHTEKHEWLKRLRMMNIHPRTLFPGLDGLGRSISDAVRLGVFAGHLPIAPRR